VPNPNNRRRTIVADYQEVLRKRKLQRKKEARGEIEDLKLVKAQQKQGKNAVLQQEKEAD
jgi:hypothetical protein